MNKLKVLIFGGTHGNEWTGVRVVEHMAERFKRKYPKLDLHFIHANVEAHKINKRFKDEDLNRAFQFLKEDRPRSYEHARAKELKKLIDAEPCFVIDLHTTTSNMGKTIIVMDYNQINFSVCARVAKKFSDCRIIGSADPQRKYLASQSSTSLMIEVGPVANGVVDPIVLEGTLQVLDETLAALSQHKGDEHGTLEIYEEIQDVHYPKNEKGEIAAYIHPEIQSRDFHPVKGLYKSFRTWEGEDKSLEANEELYPIFINEAAYYPQALAFTMCRKRNLTF